MFPERVMRTDSLLKDGNVLVPTVEVADCWWQRMRGLLGRSGLGADRGMFLAPASSIHTFFMRFPIDLIFVNRALQVTRVVRNVRPFRMVSGGWKSWGVVELESGWLSANAVAPGDPLAWGHGT